MLNKPRLRPFNFEVTGDIIMPKSIGTIPDKGSQIVISKPYDNTLEPILPPRTNAV